MGELNTRRAVLVRNVVKDTSDSHDGDEGHLASEGEEPLPS